jgi:L,D-transpeptidase ErfK/SrfK
MGRSTLTGFAGLVCASAAALGVGAAGGPELRPVMGRVENVLIGEKETLLDVAYRHRLGFKPLARLNPDVDPWIPPPGTPVALPTRYILPDAEPEGLVINLPEMRLFDFTVPGADVAGPEVFAVAVGDQADPSLVGDFKVGGKRENPTWNVPKSIREEDPSLPAQVPPGPDNPLGSRWITIGNTSYGIHGTNVRWSIGREATHGCLRLYEDAIQRLYARVPSGTRIQIVYQPIKWGVDGTRIYLEVHPDLYGLSEVHAELFDVPRALGLIDWVDHERARHVLEKALGIPVWVGTLDRTTSKRTSRTSHPRAAPRRPPAGRPLGPRPPRAAPSGSRRRPSTPRRRCDPRARRPAARDC